MAGNPFDPPDASSKNPFDPPKEAANPFDPPAAASKKNPINAAIGGALTYGHEHPFQSLLNVMQTPQRALQAVETGGDVGRAVMHPGDEPALAKAVRDRTGVQGFEDANLPGNGLGAKLGRFGIDTTMDEIGRAHV